MNVQNENKITINTIDIHIKGSNIIKDWKFEVPLEGLLDKNSNLAVHTITYGPLTKLVQA